MFTGLVETTAVVAELTRRGPSALLRLAAMRVEGALALGESISVSGVCLTVTRILADGFEADVSAETLAVTTLGALGPGSTVNIERSLKLGDRMGGHVVLGHVDGVGRVRAVEPVGEAMRVTLTAPAELAPFIAGKGSICLDGVSLTVNRTAGPDFEIMLVPHTLAVTTLKDWRAGRDINIEVDVLSRYVARQLEIAAAPKGDEALMAKLRDGGFLA
jgi:riboflavin synthase